MARREAARETTTVSGSSGALRSSAESSGSRASESNTIRVGWRWTFSIRAVSCGSSASAVPMPQATASHSARQRCAIRRESSPEIHFESPVRVATLPSSVIADLNSTHGRPVRACLRNGWLSSRARAASSPSAISDLDALVAQDPQAAARGLLRRVVGGDHDARDAGLEDRVGARRRLALVAARLQRHVQRRAVRRRPRRPRRAPRARRAARRRRRGSPRPAPRRRARRRPRPSGSATSCRGRPRRARSARARWTWSVCRSGVTMQTAG